MPPTGENSLREHLTKLAGFAEIESKIFHLQTLLQEIPEHQRTLETNLISLQTQQAEKMKQVAELESQIRKLEADLADAQEKLKTREAKLYEIKTTKEFQAAGKENTALKKQNADNENRLIQMMGQLEELKAASAPLAGEVQALQEKIESEKNRIGSELGSLQKQLGEQTDLKQGLLESIDPALVEHYEQVLIRRRPAVAAVRGGVCEECNMRIPPQLYIEMQKYLEVIGCPSCNRILHIPNE